MCWFWLLVLIVLASSAMLVLMLMFQSILDAILGSAFRDAWIFLAIVMVVILVLGIAGLRLAEYLSERLGEDGFFVLSCLAAALAVTVWLIYRDLRS